MTNKCNNCHCKCHWQDALRFYNFDNDVCTCEQCNCSKSKAQDQSFENNGGLVIDDTGECESCQ